MKPILRDRVKMKARLSNAIAGSSVSDTPSSKLDFEHDSVVVILRNAHPAIGR